MALKKQMSFTGLTVELFEDVDEVQSYPFHRASRLCAVSIMLHLSCKVLW